MPVLPGSTIGLIGGGQLGRMLALEARRMDFRTVVLDPDPAAPAGQVADEQIVAEMDDLDGVRRLAEASDVVTLEWENADVGTVRALAEMVPVHPGPDVLAVAQNRVREKETARRLGLDTAPFRLVRTLDELEDALVETGYPAVLKTVTGGYDAKGQRVIEKRDSIRPAFRALGGGGQPLILEGWVDFALEVSVICARGLDGSLVNFPVSENIHRDGILDFTVVPARITMEVADRAVMTARRMTEGLDVVGVLTVEMFVDRTGRVLVNEIAPRPHNSGHYSWEACTCSQFEQQLRAVCGLPLHPPRLLRPAAMANLLGHEVGSGRSLGAVAHALGIPDTALHLYGKAEPRPGRKMGHLTALAETPELALERATAARDALVEGWLRLTDPV
ncbi:MAG TPA: 5-(carboxyamino)imidazole ribonucleotide synthase [Longimicrobiaceae bacterium]|nr:5-(carboxyamino)imidazole ribonucleotide synthase [Longimicrobiaceae bacterium]